MSRADDIFDNIALMTGETVIWAEQNAPRPPVPYWTMRLSSNRSIGADEASQGVDDDGDQIIDGVREETLELQRIGEGSLDSVLALRNNFMKISVKDTWRKSKLNVFDFGDVLNVPYLIDNAAYESRATLDIFLRSRVRIEDKVGIIERVRGDGTLSETAIGTNLACVIEAVYTGP